MLIKVQSAATRVTTQVLGISAIIAILFIAGCASGGGSAQFAVTTSGQLATVVINASYPQTTLAAANGTAPYTWAVTGGALPTGLMLSPAGLLSGTPTAFGTFSFTVTVTDSATPTPHTATASLTVMVNPAITSVALNPTTVAGGTASTGTVTLSGAAAAAASVTLASSNAAATVPATVTVAAGQTTATFQVATTAVSASVQPTITATYGVAKTAVLTVNPPTVQSVALTLSTVTGGTSTTGTVTLTGPAATGGDSVTLTSDNAAAQVPATVSVAAGQTSTQFNVTTSSVVSSATAHIQGSFNSSSQSATLTVLSAVAIRVPTFPIGVVSVSYASPAFSASGGSGSGYTYAISGGSIAPLAISANTGIISGTPTTATTLQFSVKVTDSLGFTATASGLSITINPAITVGLSPSSPATLDQGKTQVVTATVINDPGSAGVNWSAVTGLGTLTGQTTTSATYNAPASVSAASTATFTATSITDPSKSATYTINLVPPPSITTTTMAAGNVNGAYTSPVAMTGGVAPYTWSFTALPTGLALSASTTSTVNVTGTPTVAGANQTATIKVTDAQGLSATSSGLTITVYSQLVITPPSLPLPTGVVNVAYPAETFTASGGSGSGYTFSLASGSLPSPLTVGAGGTIASTVPTASGTFTFAVKVTDSVANSATTANISLTINPAITVGLAPASPVTLDQSKTQLITAAVTNDPGSAGANWSITSGAGTLTGSTTTTVTYNAPVSIASASTATVKATSITDPSKSATFTINLVPPPSITTTTMAAGNVNGAYTSPVAMTGGVAPYTWSFTALPTGLALSASTTSTVNVTGTPTVAGANQTATIKVTDAQGLSATSSGLTISVYSQLVITPPTLPLPTGVVNVAYPAETFTASGGSGSGYTFSLASGSLPSPLTVGAGGTIASAVPTASGTFTFAVKVTDSVANSATTANISLTINPVISVTLAPAQPFSMDQNTSQLITATVSNDLNSAGVTWSTLTGLGSLSGSTTSTITYNAPASISTTSIATFTATSITDPSKSASFSVSLEPPPTITTSSLPSGTVGAAYNSPVTTNGGVGPYTWSFTALPAGLSLSSSTTDTVNIIGTPTTSGASQTATIKVTDAKGLSYTLNSTITVNVVSCSSNCTISGTVTGPTVSGVAIALSGQASANTTTDISGNYSFTGLAGGIYTVTPTLAGYTFSPSAPSVPTTGAITTQDFTETSALSSFSISGTISYAGSKTGNTIIRVYPSGCSGGCGSMAGTSFTTAPSVSGTAYIIRGLPAAGGGGNGNGSYVISAEIDTLGTGIPNESNPEGTSGTVNITTANVTGANFSIVDRTPSTAQTPTKVSVAPGNGGAVVQYQDPEDSSSEEIASSYKVYYGTDTNASNGIGSPKTFKAQGQGTDIFILKGLTNGLTYFKVSAVNSAGESAATTPISATLAAGSGANTVSGTVTFPGTATGHTLYVGAYGNNGIFFTAITSPVSPQAYSIAGVPSGTYQNFAILDLNDDGEVNPPDITNVTNHSNPPTITASGNTTGNITLASSPVSIGVPTSVSGSSGQPNSYSISVQVDFGTKLPISMTLISGNNVAVPYDMNADSHNANYNPIYNNSVSPTVGDAYQFLVTFSDGTTQVVTSTVSAVLTSFAQNLAMQTTSPGSPTVPLLTWAAPAVLPTALPYAYSVTLYNNNGTSQEFWNYYGSGSGNGIPSTQTNVLFNTDGSANPATLTVGGSYNWSVSVQDNNNNQGSYTTTYVVP